MKDKQQTTIRVNKETKKKLMQLKLDLDFKSSDKLIEYLLEKTYKKNKTKK